MDKFYNDISSVFNDLIAKIHTYKKAHPDIYLTIILLMLCGLFLFFGLNFYPLIDVDETRYAVMARDMVNSNSWNDLLLNGVPFLEKPPLYFWLVGASIKCFNGFNGFIVRFPIALVATLTVLSTYFFGRRVVGRKFGFMSAVMLLTSTFFLVLSHIAILDLLIASFIALTLYCGFLSHIVSDKYKKYCWWGFWTFAGVGFLAKGLLAIAIPMTIMFIYNFITKSLKDIFKPVNLFVGLIIFVAIAAPWHIAMFKEYGYGFITEYFIYHHFARFIDSAHIGRKQPFLYFIPVFLVAFLPWSITFISALYKEAINAYLKFKNIQGSLIKKCVKLFEFNTNRQKMLAFAFVYFLVTFGVVSVSSTKLPTYILPSIPSAALFTAYFWCMGNRNKRAIENSTYILASIFILAAVVFVGVYYYLPEDITALIIPFRVTVTMGCSFVGMFLITRLSTKKISAVFTAYIVLMFFIISFANVHLFNLMYKGGENELVKYSKYATPGNNRLVTFDFAVKPSVMINYPNHVNFVVDPDFEMLNNITENDKILTYIIVKNKNMQNNNYKTEFYQKYYLVEKGSKYTLFVNKPLPKKIVSVFYKLYD